MRSSYLLSSRLLVLAAAFGPLAGCPTNDGTDTDTDATGATTGSPTTTGATMEPTTTEVISTTFDQTSSGTTADPTGDTTADPTGDSTGESTGGTTTGTTGGDDSLCDCISPGPVGASSVICGSNCGTLSADCTDDKSEAECEAELDCAIDVLIAGDGNVKWMNSSNMGFSTSGAFVKVFPNREGLTRSWSQVDLGLEDSDAGLVTLKPVEYFEACKAEPTFGGKYTCLRDWSDEEPTDLCDEADMATDF